MTGATVAIDWTLTLTEEEAERLLELLSVVRLTLGYASSRGVKELTQGDVDALYETVCDVCALLDIEPIKPPE